MRAKHDLIAEVSNGKALPWRRRMLSRKGLLACIMSMAILTVGMWSIQHVSVNKAFETDEEEVPKTVTAKWSEGQYQQRQRPKLTTHERDRIVAYHSALEAMYQALPTEDVFDALTSPLAETGIKKATRLCVIFRQFARYWDIWERVHIVRGNEIEQEEWMRTNMYSKFLFSSIPWSVYTQFETLITSFTQQHLPFLNQSMLDLRTSYYGKGVVTCAGGVHVPYLLTSIRMNRLHGCSFPVEVFYIGDADMSLDLRDELEDLGSVRTRDLTDIFNDEVVHLKGWSAKPYTILASSFAEAIFIDADALFFQSPTILFTDPSYIETGSLFFKDRTMYAGRRVFKQRLSEILPAPVTGNVKLTGIWQRVSVHQQESGVIVLDKRRHFLALLVVCLLNGIEREEKTSGFPYRWMYGDKELFWLGFEVAGDTDYAFHPQPAGVMGALPTSDPTQPTTLCAPQMLHFDREGQPLWFNGWIFRNKFAHRPVVSEFEAWVKEPGVWHLRRNGNACLTVDVDAVPFNRNELSVLEIILGLWKPVAKASAKRAKARGR